MVVALSNEAYLKLVKMISEKLVIRKYLVAVVGKVDHPFDVNAPIGRDPHNPTRMAVVQSGKSALTHFKPISVLSNNVSLLEAQLYTGRTHQIRVHLKYEGLYVLGDTVYGNSESQVLAPRVFLHSYYLRLRHPVTGEMLQFMSPLPPDLQMAWNNLGGDNIVYSAICA
jgi:23S rRNA pseudouridine1911/1915/1917 synthase